MTAPEAKACILLISQLWTNSKTPSSESEIQLASGMWLTFFGKTPCADVTKVIYEIAAEGGEFAPQVGQIYARYKAKRQALTAHSNGPTLADMYSICNTYAKICGIEPPPGGLNGEQISLWFETARMANKEAQHEAC